MAACVLACLPVWRRGGCWFFVPRNWRGRVMVYGNGTHQSAVSQTGFLHLVPDAGPDHVRRLRALDRFRPGLPGLARLLWQRDAAGRHGRHPRSVAGHAVRPGHVVQGLDRNDPSLCRRDPGHADHRHCLHGLALPEPAGPLAGSGHRDADRCLRAGCVRRLDRDPQADARRRDHAPGVRPVGAGADDLAVVARAPASARGRGGRALEALGGGGLRAAAGAGNAGWLGQHQLRRAGLHGLPAMPRRVGAWKWTSTAAIR